MQTKKENITDTLNITLCLENNFNYLKVPLDATYSEIVKKALGLEIIALGNNEYDVCVREAE